MDINDIKANVGEVRVWVKQGKREGFIKFDEIGYALFRIWEGMGRDIKILKITYDDIELDKDTIDLLIDELDNHDPDEEFENK